MSSAPTSPLPSTTPNRASQSTTRSDVSSTAETDCSTVMAEQITHNVVNNPESTSGMPLVDAALSQSTADSALRGTQTSLSADPSTVERLESNTIIEPAKLDHVPVHAPVRSDAASGAAEPSAGDATNLAAQDLLTPHADEAQMNGGREDDASQGEGPADDRSVDVSVNSDTDNSRADAKEGGHHVRTNSVKKPTTFSKITATKNFMNKIAPTPTPSPKIGDKPTPISAVLQQSSKPRLVAKTGPSLANLQKSRMGSDSAAGPDANKVWNKNRPQAPPPPKQFTDEELKQQYGIHLATRLQTDDKKESTWADIDDDEDDWVPETVNWVDGTKSTLTPQQEPTPVPPPKEQKAAPAQSARPAEGVRPTLALKSRTGGEAMKILKPGAAASQAKPPGSAAPSPGPEKASLKAKSPAPAPAKSPWAPVPKVESISPINPPVQQTPAAPPQLAPQDARAYEAAYAPPAREIAADTFDRGWREGEGGARELFNSTNGRYEPAPEGRRSSVKPDSALRKPAVLQRPSPSGMPAEPSAAFQSRTTSQMDGSWGGRRRGSSVSQGSIPPPRRMSTTQRPDLGQMPEDTQAARSARSSREGAAKPSFVQPSPWDQQLPPRPDSSALESTPSNAPAAPAEDPVQVQERVMREKRETAKKRRLEEEQRAEAEKQERLKAKLAALEGAGKSKKEREAEAAAAAAAAAAKEATSEKAASEQPAQPEPAQPAESAAIAGPSLEAQALPPPPPEQARPKPSPADSLPSPLPPKPQSAGLPDRPISSEQPAKQLPRSHLSPRASARTPYQQQQSASQRVPTSSYSSPGDRKPQPAIGRSPNLGENTFSPWPTTAPSSNVWGSSGIGNGTFEGTSTFAPVPMSQQSSSLPPPPGMTRPPATTTRFSPQGFGHDTRSPSMQHSQIVEQQRAFAPPDLDARPDAFSGQSRLNGMSPAPGMGRPVHPPGPIGPPSRAQQTGGQHRRDPLSAWNNAAAALPEQYERDVAAAAERRKQDLSIPVQLPQNSYKETFKKTSAEQGRLGAPRKYESTEYTIHDAQGSRAVSSLSPAPPAAQSQTKAPLSVASPMQDPWKHGHEHQVRIPNPSLNPAHGGQLPRQPPIAPPHARQAPHRAHQGPARTMLEPLAPMVDSKEQSPPPPEADGQLVSTGDMSHPHVKLPPPQVKVRLPPASPSGSVPTPVNNNGSVMMPQRPASSWAAGPPGAARPIVMNEAWQARFNGLFNRTPIQTETPPSPPKTPPKVQGPVLAVASASRTAMDEQASGATVSLPQTKKRANMEESAIDDSIIVVSKPAIDQMFDEERGFGSMPRVRVPRNTAYDTSPYTIQGKKQYQHSRLQKQIEATSSDEPFFWRNPQGYFVTVPGTKLQNKLCRVSGAAGAPGRPDRKPSHAQAHSTRERPAQQDRKASARFSKNKDSKEGSTHNSDSPASATPVSEGAKKPSSQRNAASARDAPKTEGLDGKKKSGGSKPRGGRHHGAGPAPASASATTVKSS